MNEDRMLEICLAYGLQQLFLSNICIKPILGNQTCYLHNGSIWAFWEEFFCMRFMLSTMNNKDESMLKWNLYIKVPHENIVV